MDKLKYGLIVIYHLLNLIYKMIIFKNNVKHNKLDKPGKIDNLNKVKKQEDNLDNLDKLDKVDKVVINLQIIIII